jgi:hypothetical protein
MHVYARRHAVEEAAVWMKKEERGMSANARQIDRETWYGSLLRVQRLVDAEIHVALRRQAHASAQEAVDTRLQRKCEVLIWNEVASSTCDQAEETDRET